MMQLLTLKQLKRDYVHYSNTHLLRLELEGKFPRRIKPYGGRNGKAFYVRDEILEWIEEQIDKRDSSLNASS